MSNAIYVFKEWFNALFDSLQKPDYTALQRDLDWYRRIEHIDEPIIVTKRNKRAKWK